MTHVDRPTSARPREISGHVWRCYHTGVMRTEWRTDGGRWVVGRHGETSMYWARCDGRYLCRPGTETPKRFMSMAGACKAAVAA